MRCLIESIAYGRPYQPFTDSFIRRCPLLNQPTYPVWMVGCTTCSPRAQVPTFQRADRSFRIGFDAST